MLGGATLWLAGCTAILTPRDDVQRCGAVDDCDPIDDTRYVPACTFPPGTEHDEDDPKICVATYAPVRCDPARAGAGHPLFETYEALRLDRSRFVRCDPGVAAPRGCPGGVAGCELGLVVRADGVCDAEAAPEIPAFAAEALAEAAQDVLDAYCQAFFCDARFVCDAGTCEPCSVDEPWGEGGCGRIFSAGVPSCIYPDPVASCQAPDADPDAPVFGACGGS
ncbi:MAG TPA: hypothetical protein VKY73_03550 [Polyangiaceae bacterium]|nr:hypothetical protein [Polyangiaceae bacterium]